MRDFRFKTTETVSGQMRNELSKREGEVLSWLHQGMSDKEIALALKVSPRTVQKHLQRIYLHLDVHTRAEARQKANRPLKGGCNYGCSHSCDDGGSALMAE